MLTVLREFLTRAEDGREMLLCESQVETDTTTMHTVGTRTMHRDRYFRQVEGGMHAMRALQMEPGVFRLEDGTVVREVPQG